MDAGVVYHEMDGRKEGEMSSATEDGLVELENGNSSLSERDSRTMLTEHEEAFLLSGLEEIEGLMLDKEYQATLDMHDPVVKKNFQTIGQSNWLYHTLNRNKNIVTESDGPESPERDKTRGESSFSESLQENMSTSNYRRREAARNEGCDSDERDSESDKTKLAQFPWMGNTLLQILGDSFVTRLQETHPISTSKLLSDNVSLTNLSSTGHTEDEVYDEAESNNVECAECDNKDDLQEVPESTQYTSGHEDEETPLKTSSIIDIDYHLKQEEGKRDGIDPLKENVVEKEEAAKSKNFARSFTVQYSQTKDPIPIQPFLDIDNVELTERFKKIVSAFGDKQKTTFSKAPWLQNTSGEDEADSGGEICMDKMMTVIKRLDKVDNWFHYFMNALPMIGKGSNKAEYGELLTEMQEICPTGSGKITLNRFKIYHIKHLNGAPPPVEVEDRRPSWKRISLKWREKKRASDKLLKYFRAIAEAKKMHFTITRVFFPLLTLLILGTHIYVLSQESQRSHQLKFALQFDT